MTKILVVDDSAMDRRLAGSFLDRAPGTTVLYANDGREALAVVTSQSPDIVVTDLQMPGMNGLDLVDAMRALSPTVPVVLMTAHGSEEIAATALRRGAASYVPKRELATDLARTVSRLLDLARAASPPERVLACIEATECRLVLPNDVDLVAPVVTYLRAELARLGAPNPTLSMQVGVALDEAISNAIHHGNLEVSSRLREESMSKYLETIETRRRTPPYCARKTRVTTRIARDRAEFVVRDDGGGFDVRSLPDPRDPENLERCSGRGVLLVRMFMDEVRYNEQGNEITMAKLLT
jgi:CheY-like chemotaxis protein/anti-sigma regulatory factor (Ser/Thr protein kinase)